MSQDELIRRVEDLMRENRRLKADNAELRQLVAKMEDELAQADVTVETLQTWVNHLHLQDRISVRRPSIN